MSANRRTARNGAGAARDDRARTPRIAGLRVFMALAAAVACGTPLSAHPEAGSFSRRSEVVQTVERMGPAVVNISTERRVRSPFSTNPWEEMMRRFFDLDAPDRPREEIQHSLGSGVIIDPEGFILTNEHVIAGASTIQATLSDGRVLDAEVVGTDQDADLAVLRVTPSAPLPTVPIHEEDDLMIGESVIAIGNPFGLSNTVSVGVISGRERSVRSGDHTYTDFIQTDAAINPGNSGGALLDINGRLLGINTAIVGGAEGIGFAIPASRAMNIYRELVRYGEVRPIWLGFEVSPVGDQESRRLGLGGRKGLIVTDVTATSPAAKGGVEAGDLLVQAGGRRVESADDLDTVVGRTNVGQEIPVTVVRDGVETTLSLRAADFPFETYAYTRLGIRVSDVDSNAKRLYRGVPDSGAVVTEVRRGGAADRLGLAVGDTIVQVDNARVLAAEDLLHILPRIQQRRSVYLGIVRGGYLYRVTMSLD